MEFITAGDIICQVGGDTVTEIYIDIPISIEPIDDPNCIIGHSKQIISEMALNYQVENYPEGNWFIPKFAAFGACPYVPDNYIMTLANLKTLCKSFGLIVCLQKEYPISPSSFSTNMISYYETIIMEKIAKKPQDYDFDSNWTPPDFKICRIPDCGIVNDDIIGNLADICISYIKRRIPIFIHCWGGHGRAGTLAGIILAKMYRWTYLDIAKYLQTVHDYRELHVPCLCPQKQIQCDQINRFTTSY